jgi:type I restriction enzyme S subunit
VTQGKLVEFCDLTNGRGFKKSEWSATGLPIIRIQNLNGSIDFNRTEANVDSRHCVRAGDLLYAWSATIGPYLWPGEDAALNQHIFKVTPGPEVTKEYLYFLLLEATRELKY